MQNQLEQEAVSVRLYNYLSEEVVGSENIVRYRRLYYKLHEDIFIDNELELISSGSKAEGLDLPGSDFDVMLIFKLWEVYENMPKDKEDILLLDTEIASPGFALLKTPDSSSFPCSQTKTADGNFILNSDFHNLIFKDIGKIVKIFETHGPCLAVSCFVDYDILGCFKLQTWPTVAKQWLLRFRPSGWPSHDIISKIVSDGCLLVPVGSKSECSPCNHFEWRFSFSLAEKLLVYSFNHTQLLCYVLLKIWLKELLYSDIKLHNTLCSYFMKTVLFWIIEEGELNWIPQNLLHCFLLCIHRLHYWITCGYLPSYFIPEHNMIDGKLSRKDLAYLSLSLENMNMHENWKIMFSVPSLRHFHFLPINMPKKSVRLAELDEAILSLQTFGHFMDAIPGTEADSKFACLIYRMVHKNLPKSARKILILMLLKQNDNRLASLNIENHENKPGYFGYKGCLSRILMNTFYNAESGWLLLAAFFYATQKYHNMSCILHLSSIILSFKNCIVQNDFNVQSFRDFNRLRKLVYSRSFFKRIRYEITRVFYIDYKSLMAGNYQFLTEEIPKTGFIGGLKLHSSFFFLKFLYGRKQGNSLVTQSALLLLKRIFEEEIEKSTNCLCYYTSYTLLFKAFELLNDKKQGLYCGLRFITAIKRSDMFESLVKCEDEEFQMALDLESKFNDKIAHSQLSDPA